MKSLQLDKPHAIVVIGIQGSGKTFFAEKFATTFNAPYLEQALFNGAARDDKAALYLFESVLSETLKTGRSLVMELANSSRAERAEIAKKLSSAGYQVMLVWVQVDQETAMMRAKRASGINQADYRDEVKRFSAPIQSEKALVISGKHTFASQAKVVLKKLSSPRPSKPLADRTQPYRGQIIVR